MRFSGRAAIGVSVQQDGPAIPSRVQRIPDRSVVTALQAREALEALFIAGKWERCNRGLDLSSAQVLATILRQYAELGRPPSLKELAAAVGAAEAKIDGLLRQLHRRDLIVLDATTGAIEGAYPFTQKSSGHSVTLRRTGRTLATMCAIDALGAGAMCREDAAIRSACRLCGTQIAGAVTNRGLVLAGIRPSDTVIWVGLLESGGCAADTLCTELLFFCCDAHLNEWRSGKGFTGYRLSPEEAFQVGKALFIDRALMNDEAT